MRTFALACTTAIAMGLGIQDASSPPGDVHEITCHNRNKFGCMWPYDMNFRHSDYFVQSAYCKQQQLWMKIIEDDTPGQFFDGLFSVSFFL